MICEYEFMRSYDPVTEGFEIFELNSVLHTTLFLYSSVEQKSYIRCVSVICNAASVQSTLEYINFYVELIHVIGMK